MIQTVRLIFLHGNLAEARKSSNLDSDIGEKKDNKPLVEEDVFSKLSELKFKHHLTYQTGAQTNIVYQREADDPIVDMKKLSEKMQMPIEL